VSQRYVLLITCMHTRGVHFELSEDQTTDAVLQALIRFSSIRGYPSTIYSDNQTSLVRAGKEMHAWVKDLDLKVLAEKFWV